MHTQTHTYAQCYVNAIVIRESTHMKETINLIPQLSLVFLFSTQTSNEVSCHSLLKSIVFLWSCSRERWTQHTKNT